MRLRIAAFASTAIIVAIALSGCTNDSLADQYRNGDNKNYVAGDGAITEFPLDHRDAPVSFVATDDEGVTVSAADYRGQVLVLNFWYAGCAPCRAEAPNLEALSQKYSGQGAEFLGVNVRDKVPTAQAFAKEFGISYPNVTDTKSDVQLALTGKAAPNAVPTTIVIDKEGRVAARILGQLTEPTILDTLVRDAIAEI